MSMKLPDLVIRPARPEDKPAVMSLVAQIWDGGDYIPEVWDDWLADVYGELTVAESEGQLVCVTKLTRLRPGSWWLEGMRVAPAFRGRGIAQAVFDYQLDLSKRVADGLLGLGTSSGNTPVHQMMARTNFQRVAAFVKYTAMPLPASEPFPFRLATPADRNLVHRWLTRSQGSAAGYGLVENHWCWYPLLPALEDELAADRLHLWTPAGEAMAGLVWVDRGEEHLLVGLADAPLPRLESLLRDLRGWPEAEGRVLSFKPPAVEPYIKAIEAAGWTTDWDASLWIFHKTIEGVDK